jgi:hypothetical protein
MSDQNQGMTRPQALRLEFFIIGLGIFALLLIFQPFSLRLFAIGSVLVVIAGRTAAAGTTPRRPTSLRAAASIVQASADCSGVSQLWASESARPLTRSGAAPVRLGGCAAGRGVAIVTDAEVSGTVVSGLGRSGLGGENATGATTSATAVGGATETVGSLSTTCAAAATGAGSETGGTRLVR